jgi:hypothetical protein
MTVKAANESKKMKAGSERGCTNEEESKRDRNGRLGVIYPVRPL